MTESTPCTGCDRYLAPDDRFCSRCGTPVDPDATIVVDPRPEESDSPTDDNAVAVTDDAPESAALPPGASFTDRVRHVLGGEYEITSLIGQGGFARVYMARDRRLDRVVAIKVIRPDFVGRKRYVDSFRTEGIALAKLRHPGIIPIYDIRERGDLIYYVMPFVEGATLEERLDRGRLPPYESRRILSELTDALAATHRANMAHMDIKPANVFLEGDLGKVLLMDFGTAMAVTEEIEESSDAMIAGTPAYMSPEQARGLPDVDHRSDIYSLGALGYRMLMGRPPFAGKDATAVLKKHISEAPVPIRKINPSIPRDFADAVMRCLEKDPADRFPTAKALEAALESVTFTTGRDTTSHEATSGTSGPVVLLIALFALFVGLLIGQVIG
jgi:serine/threonine-protein kinase